MTPNEIQGCFDGIQASLERQDWFRAGAWLCDSHPFPAQAPDGITFQVYKAHWLNQDHHGIHIESYLDFIPLKQKKSFVTLHLLHLPLIPGTRIKRKQLAQGVIDRLRGEIESWPGYVFRAGPYGQQPFTRLLDGSSADFASTLKTEITRLAQTAGPIIDEVLQSLTKY